MQFIPNTQILSEENKQKIRKMEQQKMMTAQVNMQVKEKLEPVRGKKNPLDMMKYINQLSRQQKHENLDEKEAKPKEASIKEIEKSLKIRKLMEEEAEKKLQDLLSKGEVKEVKEGITHLLAMPHFDKIKRKLFHQRLARSEIVDDYLNHSIILQYFNETNRHLKFALAYGLNYLRTNDDYENLLLLQQIRAQQSHQPQQQQQQTPEEKDETNSERSSSSLTPSETPSETATNAT